MFETMAAAEGVGLAANQVGVPRRLFVYDCPDEERGERVRGVVVNPVLETSERPETMPDPDDDEEGCLSVPAEHYPTGRADWARVTGVDAAGEPVAVEGRGFLARCLQHEVDHLDGVIYIDRLVGRNRRAALQGAQAQRLGGARAGLGPGLAGRRGGLNPAYRGSCKGVISRRSRWTSSTPTRARSARSRPRSPAGSPRCGPAGAVARRWSSPATVCW